MRREAAEENGTVADADHLVGAHPVAGAMGIGPELRELVRCQQRIDGALDGDIVEFTVGQRGDLHPLFVVDLEIAGPHYVLVVHGYHLLSLDVPSNGRNSEAIDSRARKMRERTVPIGQFIAAAMSS